MVNVVCLLPFLKFLQEKRPVFTDFLDDKKPEVFGIPGDFSSFLTEMTLDAGRHGTSRTARK